MNLDTYIAALRVERAAFVGSPARVAAIDSELARLGEPLEDTRPGETPEPPDGTPPGETPEDQGAEAETADARPTRRRRS